MKRMLARAAEAGFDLAAYEIVLRALVPPTSEQALWSMPEAKIEAELERLSRSNLPLAQATLGRRRFLRMHYQESANGTKSFELVEPGSVEGDRRTRELFTAAIEAPLWAGADDFMLPLAYHSRGNMILNGWGGEKSEADGVKDVLAAAKRGSPDANLQAGGLYELGKGVTRSRMRALAHYRKAAELGHERAAASVRELEELIVAGARLRRQNGREDRNYRERVQRAEAYEFRQWLGRQP